MTAAAAAAAAARCGSTSGSARTTSGVATTTGLSTGSAGAGGGTTGRAAASTKAAPPSPGEASRTTCRRRCDRCHPFARLTAASHGEVRPTRATGGCGDRPRDRWCGLRAWSDRGRRSGAGAAGPRRSSRADRPARSTRGSCRRAAERRRPPATEPRTLVPTADRMSPAIVRTTGMALRAAVRTIGNAYRAGRPKQRAGVTGYVRPARPHHRPCR